MRALVVYESMFGNTRRVAEGIAEGLSRAGCVVRLVTAAEAPADVTDEDLVVVGAPTHAHTLPQPASRTEAAAWADDPGKSLVLEATASDPGVREWLAALPKADRSPRFAAFSTRVDMPRIFTGDASGKIEKRLKDAGAHRVERECFLVDKDSALLEGERDRAEAWASSLVEGVPA